MLGEVAHACNLRTLKRRQEDQDFKASPGYMVSLRLAWTNGILSQNRQASRWLNNAVVNIMKLHFLNG